MSIPQNSGVKTLQHPKAIGNARTQARGFMFPVLISDLDFTETVTAYGVERGPSTDPSSHIPFDPATNYGIIAVGRLERIPTESALKDVRIVQREAYRLYWLPSGYQGSGNDYNRGTPSPLDDQLLGDPSPTLGFRKLEPGMRVWISAEAVGGVPKETNQIDDALMVAFEVIEAPVNVSGEVIEFEAIIAKDETAPRRRASSL